MLSGSVPLREQPYHDSRGTSGTHSPLRLGYSDLERQSRRQLGLSMWWWSRSRGNSTHSSGKKVRHLTNATWLRVGVNRYSHIGK